MKYLHIFVSALLIGVFCASCAKKQVKSETPVESDSSRLTSVVFSGDSAYAYVVKQCDFGPRTPGSEAHADCGDWLASKFRSFGLNVTEQKAPVTAWDGKTFICRNIVASYRSENPERVLICAHWDSRPWADCEADENRRMQAILGANDGASGIAVMLELARLVESLNPAVGVDFICFDLEDYGRPEWEEPGGTEDEWCLGSAYWAAHPHVAGYRARYGILLDMVGDAKAKFHYEGFSLRYAPGVLARVWGVAQSVGAGALFVQADGAYVTDDHLPLNRVAGIPTIDIIDFQGMGQHSFAATWHTLADTPENISPLTLRTVGQTLLQVLAEEE